VSRRHPGLRQEQRAAERVLNQCTKTLGQDLKLKVNREKSKISPASGATLLGSGFYSASGAKLRVAPKALKRVKARIKQLTSRKWSISLGERITLLNRFVRGWMNYFPSGRYSEDTVGAGQVVPTQDATNPVEGMEETAYPRG
jgi:hypothetical protein